MEISAMFLAYRSRYFISHCSQKCKDASISNYTHYFTKSILITANETCGTCTPVWVSQNVSYATKDINDPFLWWNVDVEYSQPEESQFSIVNWYSSGYFCIFCQTAAGSTDCGLGGCCLLESFEL